jgi:hypothetical protein
MEWPRWPLASLVSAATIGPSQGAAGRHTMGVISKSMLLFGAEVESWQASQLRRLFVRDGS